MAPTTHSGRSATRERVASSGLDDGNQAIANLVLDLAELHRASPRFWGYKRAARTIRRLPYFLVDLTKEEILAIPTIGPATYRVVDEFLASGRSASVERAIEDSGHLSAVEGRRRLRGNFLSNAAVQRILKEPRRHAVDAADYRGDFQMHSVGSDGAGTLEEMVEACMDRGYTCACVTDHSYGLPIAGGMSVSAMRQQHAEIEAMNLRYGARFTLFRGIEANILVDGRLDLPPDELRELDLVVASPHSSLRKREDQTARMLQAVSTPGVQILGHPRGRMFNLRAGVLADWPAVFERAAAMGVAVELDGDTSRQDLDFELAAVAKDAGCMFALDSDAHAPDQLFMAEYAIAHARLAGIPRESIINCWPADRILDWAATAWDR